MKKIITVLIVISAIIISCKKEVSAPAITSGTYMNFTPNSTWNYDLTDNATATNLNYTITSSSKDTLAGGKTYHVFTNSTGVNEYYNVSGNDYYVYQSLPAVLGGAAVQNLYLKDNVDINTSWNQTYTFTVSNLPLTVIITNTVSEKGISKTINTTNYADVIHITTTISLSILGMPLPAGALTTDIQSYYAKNYGMIQSKNKISLNYNGVVDNTDQLINLKVANIK